jgi:hypothetical protein|tara:strand:+ start:70 stop:261 length:192 start_codon:yes stop_codon:yes gene_type:complete
MEVIISEEGNFEFLIDKMDIILSMLGMGFTIGLWVVVVVASIRLGWKLWPWVLAVGALAFLFF